MARQRKARQGKATQGREVETIEWEDRVPKKFADEIKKSSPEDKNALIDRVIKIHGVHGANFCEGKLAIPIVDIYNFTCADKSEVTLQCTSTRYVIWKKADGKVDFAAICEIVMVDQDGTKNVLKEDQILSLTTFTLRTLHSLGVNAYNKCCVQLPAITTIDSIPVKFKFNHELFISKDLGKFNSRWLIRIVVPAVVAAANMELQKEIGAAKRKQTRKVKAVNKIRENNGDRSAPSNEENNGSTPTVAPPLRSAAPPPPGAGGGLDGGGAGATGSGGGGLGLGLEDEGTDPTAANASALVNVAPVALPSDPTTMDAHTLALASNALALQNAKSNATTIAAVVGQQRQIGVIDDHLVRNDEILLDHAGQLFRGSARTDVLEDQVAGLGQQNALARCHRTGLESNMTEVQKQMARNDEDNRELAVWRHNNNKKTQRLVGENRKMRKSISKISRHLSLSSSSHESYSDSTVDVSVTVPVIDHIPVLPPTAIVTENTTPRSSGDGSELTDIFHDAVTSPVSNSSVGDGNAENNDTMCADFSNLDVAHALEGPANPDPASTAAIASISTTVVPPSDVSLTQDMTARVCPSRALPTAGRKSVSFVDDDDESSGDTKLSRIK